MKRLALAFMLLPLLGMQTPWPWSKQVTVLYRSGCGYEGWQCGTWDGERGYAVPGLGDGDCVEFGNRSLALTAAVWKTGEEPLMVQDAEDGVEYPSCERTLRVDGTVIEGGTESSNAEHGGEP